MKIIKRNRTSLKNLEKFAQMSYASVLQYSLCFKKKHRKLLNNPVCNTCTLLYNNAKYVDANLDAPDNAISDNESSSEMLTSQSQIPE